MLKLYRKYYNYNRINKSTVISVVDIEYRLNSMI